MSYIYETKKVESGRTYKLCYLCHRSIEVGEPSITVVVNYQPSFSNISLCMECEGREAEILEDEM